jgi:hypothetical protein
VGDVRRHEVLADGVSISFPLILLRPRMRVAALSAF